jgi:hypothetical protein
MHYPLNELIDRYTIHMLKHERTSESQDRALGDFLEAMREFGRHELFEPYIQRLYEINGLMWDAEAAIRGGQDEGLGLEEIGRRALRIRDLNRRRVEVKNEIVDRFRSGYRDVKVNYALEAAEQRA